MTSDGMLSIKPMVFKIWSATAAKKTLDCVWKRFERGLWLVYGLHRDERGLKEVCGWYTVFIVMKEV
jgi:hypothetical protein